MKFYKKIFSILMSAMLVLTMSAGSLQYYAFAEDGGEGSDEPVESEEFRYYDLFYYKLIDGELHITRAYDDIHLDEDGEITEIDRCQITELVIPETLPVDGEFYPVEYIGTSGGNGAFRDCFNLTTVSFPSGLKYIEDNAFAACTSLTEVELPAGLEYLGGNAFGTCTELSSINIPKDCRTNTNAGENQYPGPFSYTPSLTNVELEEGRTFIDNGFFDDSGITEITIPDSVTDIGRYAFRHTENLTTVNISENSQLQKIGWSAFSESAITSFYMPDTVDFVDVAAFAGCEQLESVRLSPNMTCNENQPARGYDTGVFEGCYALDNFIFPEGLTKIGRCWFFVCPIESITIPATVTEIEDHAFRYCTDLKEVKFEEGCQLETIGEAAFRMTESLTSFDYPETLKTIGGYAFQMSGLTSADIPDTIETVYYGAYAECPALTSATIPAEMTYDWGDSGDCGAFDGSNELKTVVFRPGVTKIDAGLFGWNEGIESIEIPEGVTEIGGRAFRRAYNLRTVTLPESLEKIDFEAFSECESLEELHFKGSRPKTGSLICDGVEATVYFRTWDKIPDDWGGELRFVGNISDETEVFEGYVNASYYHTYDEKQANVDTTEVYYSDLFFSRDNSDYYHDLALASLGLDLAGYKRRHVKEFLEDCHFDPKTIEQAERYDYPKTDDKDEVAYTFANKTVRGQTIVAISLRGGDYGNEWGSNGRVGRFGQTFGYHYAFNAAAEFVLGNLMEYCAENDIDLYDAKVWLVGYSRSGAVANLLGEKLEKNGLVSDTGLYCYTFATPRNVTEANRVNSRGIFNIVNPLDLVPCVPLNSSTLVSAFVTVKNLWTITPWDYTRHGTTLELPSAVGTGDYFEKLKAMKKNFSDITNGSEEYMRMDGFTLQRLLDILAELVPSEKKFVTDLQDQIIVPALEQYMAKQGLTDDAAFMQVISTLPGSQILLYQYGFGALLTSANRGSAKGGGGSKGVDGFDLKKQHWPETYLAWMMTEGIEPKAPAAVKSVFVQCPVDVEVYNPDGVLVARIASDVIDESIEGRLEAHVDEAGAKTVLMPADTDYSVKLTATDDGTMTYSVREFSEDGQQQRKAVFESIPIENGQEFTGSVAGEAFISVDDYALESNGEKIEADNDYFGDDLNNIEIDVEVEGDGHVMGEGLYTVGDSVVLSATPECSNAFEGWYSEDGELLSADAVYMTVAKNGAKYKAVFGQLAHDFGEWTVIQEPTYEEAGLRQHTCVGCGLVEQEEIEKLKRTTISGANVSGIKTKVYTGKALTQAPTVKVGGVKLVAGTDYKLSYKNNKVVGKATVTIKGIGAYEGTINRTFKINPKATTMKSVTAAKKGFTAKWNKRTVQITGYQLQYSTSSTFKSGNKTVTIKSYKTVSKKITKLKTKKKYYVRVRTYKKAADGKNYYSTWSGKKSVKTKK